MRRLDDQHRRYWRKNRIVIAILLLVWFAVSAALRPLERLRTAVEERQPDDLRPLPR